MKVLTTLLVLVALVNLLVALLVLIRNHKKTENIAFFGIGLGISFWSIGIAGFIYTNNLGDALNWAKFYYSAPIFLAFFSVLLAQSFSFYHKLPKITNVVFGLIGLALMLLILLHNNFIFYRVVKESYGKRVIIQPEMYAAYAAYLLVCFVVTISLIINKLKKAHLYLAKQQFKLFLFGFSTAVVLGVFFNLILPWFGDFRLISVGPLATTIFFSSIGYAIIKRRLFDIKIAAARSLAYTMSLATIGALFSFMSFIIIGFFFRKKSAANVEVVVAYTVIAIILAYLFPIPKKYFNKITNRLFFKDSYDLQTFLDKFNKIIVATFAIEPLLRKVSAIMEESIKSDFCFVGIKEKDATLRIIGATNNYHFEEQEINSTIGLTQPIHHKVIVTDLLEEKYTELRQLLIKNNIAIIVRLSNPVNTGGVGYLVLGYKKSGNLYSSQDLRLLEIVANELVIAIQNALHNEEIEKFNQTLQDKIKLATNRLRNTNDKLLALDEAKDDFVSMASHQLRTPLTSVKGNISLVLDGDAGEISATQKQLLQQAFISSQRMVYLISDLLNVSRIKTGKFIIEKSEVDLADIVQEEVDQLVDTAASRHLTISYKRPDNTITLMLDDTKTRQVIMNFIDNAIYYTPSGGHISVELHENSNKVELKVIDNGIGVPVHDQRYLFTKFYRAANARKARPDGTGLGLFMAKKIIMAEGGSIIFSSIEGKGSTFGFSLNKSNQQLYPLKPNSTN